MPNTAKPSQGGSKKSIGLFYDTNTNQGGVSVRIKDGVNVHVAGNTNGGAQVGFTTTTNVPCSIL